MMNIVSIIMIVRVGVNMEEEISSGTNSYIFKEPSEFSQYIENRAQETGQTCLQTIIEFLDEREAEPEKIKNLVSPSLKDKLKEDYIDLGMMRAEVTLSKFLI